MKFLGNPSAPAPQPPPPGLVLHSSTQKLRVHIPDLDLPQTGLVVLVQVHIDGEMGVDVSHLILETLRDTDNQVVDQRSDCAESGDILASAMVELNINHVLLGVGEVDCEMAEVFAELAFEVS